MSEPPPSTVGPQDEQQAQTGGVLPIIDCDAHITEPPDVWTSRIASKWGNAVPHVEWDEVIEEQGWYVGDTKIASACASAMAGWRDALPSHPRRFEEAHPASYDAAARVRLLDSAGILAQALYPNVGGFGSERFRKMKEPELALACVRAYNDFLIDWISHAPERFIPLAPLPYWDVPAATREIERCAGLGHRGVIFTGAPQDWGCPYLTDRHWDPLWSAAQACGMPVSLHLASGNFMAHFVPERMQLEGFAVTAARGSTVTFLDHAQQMTDLLLSGILPRFPDLRFVSVESGIGWIPFCLESIDYHFNSERVYEERPEFEMLPSAYYRRQVSTCYWFEQIAPRKLMDDIGARNVLFETDFPHPTCLGQRLVNLEGWGSHIRSVAEAGLADAAPNHRRWVLFENAARLYSLTLPRDLAVTT